MFVLLSILSKPNSQTSRPVAVDNTLPGSRPKTVAISKVYRRLVNEPLLFLFRAQHCPLLAYMYV